MTTSYTLCYSIHMALSIYVIHVWCELILDRFTMFFYMWELKRRKVDKWIWPVSASPISVKTATLIYLKFHTNTWTVIFSIPRFFKYFPGLANETSVIDKYIVTQSLQVLHHVSKSFDILSTFVNIYGYNVVPGKQCWCTTFNCLSSDNSHSTCSIEEIFPGIYKLCLVCRPPKS